MTEEPASPPVISVMLIVPDAAAAVAWYKTALGATELWDLGGVANANYRATATGDLDKDDTTLDVVIIENALTVLN